MDAGLQSVANFIIQLSTEAFNEQFGTSHDWQDFQIVSIPPNVNGQCAFEVSNFFYAEPVRFHLYSSVGEDNRIGRFQLLDEQYHELGLDEKVYVAVCTFNESILYLNNNFIRRECPNFPSSDSQTLCLMEEIFVNGLLSETNEIFLPEDVVGVTL